MNAKTKDCYNDDDDDDDDDDDGDDDDRWKVMILMMEMTVVMMTTMVWTMTVNGHNLIDQYVSVAAVALFPFFSRASGAMTIRNIDRKAVDRTWHEQSRRRGDNNYVADGARKHVNNTF